jgi:hypothetical protein
MRGNINETLQDPNLQLAKLEDGNVVSQRTLDIIRAIKDRYGDRVDVRWVPTHNLRAHEDQFCIVEVLPNGQEFPIMWVHRESEFDGSVLERLIAADNSDGNVYDKMQARNAAARQLQKTLAQDKMEEARDIVRHALKSPLNWYKLPNGKVIEDHGNNAFKRR